MSVTIFREASLKNNLEKGNSFRANNAMPPPPSDIPTTDLKLWLKPENITFSSGRVTGWTDASPSPLTITAPGGANNPYESVQHLNNYTGARFDGNVSSTYLQYSADIWDTGSVANATTVIALFYPETATGGNYGAIIAQGGGSKSSIACCPQAYPDASIKWATNNYAAGGRKTDGTSNVANWYKVGWTWSDWMDRSTTKIYLSNQEQTSSNWDNAPNATAGGNNFIGRFLDSGADAAIDGTLMELFVYRRVLDASELLQINNYLNTKYNLTNFVSASGGTVTTDGDYKIHTFNSSGDFIVTSGGDVDFLMVAGGGAGGTDYGGGGGGGGLITSSSFTIGVNSWPIVIGAGGTGGKPGGNGNDTTLFGKTAVGGGGGTYPGGSAPSSGGSGGGGSFTPSGARPGGAGTAGQGNEGGDGNDFGGDDLATGGGGGASAVGGDGTATNSGNGGEGTSNSLSGTATVYGSGGGGGGYSPYGVTGGTGGTNAGNGATADAGSGGTGTSNRGAGGGGGAGNQGAGGNGGSGIVIIKYKFQ